MRQSILQPYAHLIDVLPDAEVAALAGSNVGNVIAFRFRMRVRAGHVPKKRAGRPVVIDSMRSRILVWLQMHGPARSVDVARALVTGMDKEKMQDCHSQVYRLFKEGKLLRVSRGVYASGKLET